MTRSLLPPSLFIALFGTACIETWKGTDGDGDGVSLADGDCWDSAEGPPGSGLSGSDIFPGAEDLPYDGIDADCGGNDDYDLDGDGYVIDEEHVGKTTLGVEGSGNHIGAGDCWNDPARPHDFDAFEHGMIFTNVVGDQVGAADVHPDQEDTWYDGPDVDCGLNNDFDQDYDGHRTNQLADQYGAEGDDCFDLHPDDDPDINFGGLDADQIYTGATETWYDGTDQDCGGVYRPGLEIDEVLIDCDFDGDGSPVGDTSEVPEESVCRDYTGILRDCNDEVATAYPDPTREEVPYNGVDDNCSPVDSEGNADTDGDADGDGYWDVDYYARIAALPGGDELPDETVDTTDAEFTDCWDDQDTPPEGFPGEVVYEFNAAADPEDSSEFTVYDLDGDEGTPNLTAFDVNPAAYDLPYDMVDQDCAGDATPEVENDWDGDGELSQVQWYTDSGSGSLVSGDDCMDCSDDCDGAVAGDPLYEFCLVMCDNDAYLDIGTADGINPGGFDSNEVYPGATETWYDGTDQNCQADIDFDVDGDFYATDPDAAQLQGSTRTAYYSWDTLGSQYQSEEDCNDTDRFINPGNEAEEVWYDGVDQDCDGEDDYDQDYDGYVPDAYVGLATYQSEHTASDYTDYLVAGTGSAPGDDCVDVPNASDSDLDGALYNPGATDVWYDGFDKDCADNDDWDADDDGHASEKEQNTHGDYGDTYHASVVAVPGTLATDDCDDRDPDISPSDPEDWYNGDDDNCDEYDDYDQDGDGHADADFASTYGPTRNESGDIAGTGTFEADDCNDVDADINPDEDDDWYDGIDSDCAGNDDYDADEDGYASEAEAADYDFTYQSTTHAPAYVLSSTGGLTTDDCNDEEDVINPGASDSWYDGVDHDCDDRDDYDADEDGYVEDAYVGLETYQSATGDTDYVLSATGSLPGDDCVEEDADYNPGATDDWYDGLDHDCADNDDWDDDEDGHASTAAAAAARGLSYATYGDTMHDTDVAVAGVLDVDDCNDEDEDINPDEVDDWYDGVDSDCEGNDDFDADDDGFASEEEAADYDLTYQSTSFDSAYVLSSTGSLSTDDCNDEEDVINPGETDSWYDGIDHDCDERDDYDADEDGYVEDQYVGDATYQSATGDSDYLLTSTGSLPGDDCVEEDATYNPGATDDWYDGFDHDCADNDDWDEDVDGQAATAAAAAAKGATYSTYGDTMHATDVAVSGALAATDCNDDEDDIYAGASDDWYDGVDHDCEGNDDWDADEDTHAATSTAAAIRGVSYTTYGTTYQSNSATAAYAVSGTGSASVDDCNDEDATVFNGSSSETWYDGIDSDCAGDDDYDQDTDGYVEDAYVGLATYQSSSSDSDYVVAGTGSLPGDDCVEENAAYNPSAADTWYDGLDHDCADNDDWDEDGDGHAATSTAATNAGASSYSTYGNTMHDTDVAVTGVLDVDDCNDTESSIYDGATDTWYDGVDSDCAENDDWDRDTDNFASTSAAATAGGASSYTTYGTTYQSTSSAAAFAVSGTGSLAVDDCNDEDSTVNTGATDTWQDGVDQDCGGDDDYDIDTDGYVEDAYVGLATYQSSSSDADYELSSTGSLPGDDCVEADSAYNPAATDTWYDSFDHDCADNDDWDADGDSRAATSAAASAVSHAYTTYGATKHGSDDVSGTGSLSANDCNDEDSAVHGDASDTLYDGIDHDCAGNDDWDGDTDSYAATSAAATASGATSYSTYATTYQSTSSAAAYAVSGTGALPATDCNDEEGTVNPGETDTWLDGADSDCGGEDDYDIDSDGYVADAYVGEETYQSDIDDAAYILASTGSLPGDDCVEDDSAYNPGATDTWYDGIDHDCQDNDDWDEDTDGHAATAAYASAVSAAYTTYTTTTQDGSNVAGTGSLSVDDCNDAEDDVNPDESDAFYDGTDADCDGADDYDQDTDGYVRDEDSGDATYQSFDDMVSSTFLVAGTGALPDGDCLDRNVFGYVGTDYNPGITETWYDGQDQDCGSDDDYDADGDSFVDDAYVGDDTNVVLAVVYTATGGNGGDCNDDEAAFNPSAADTWYDGLDHDCDEADDYDQDLDLYVDSSYSGLATYTDAAMTAMVAGTGAASTHDCNDTDAAINGGATEVCDASNVDEDCDGLADDNDPSVDSGTQSTFYPDGDSDTYGLTGGGALFCDMPTGYVAADGDCDDGNAAINEGAQEVCDASDVDEDCDGLSDDADPSVDSGTQSTYYPDVDGDGYGENAADTLYCDPPTNYVAVDGDCDDGDGAINEGAQEICDASNTDEDCDGLSDDNDGSVDSGGFTDWYLDADGDTYGDETDVADSQCDAPTNHVADNTDCNDADSAVSPGGTEGTVSADADGIDNDCDTYVDEGVIIAGEEYLLITEIMIDPSAVTDVNGEWFEVHNPNSFDVVLNSDWEFYDGTGSGFSPPSDYTITAGGYAVFTKLGPTSINGGVTGDFVYGGAGVGLLAQAGDVLTMSYYNPEDALTEIVVDEVDWDGLTPWTIPTGASLQLDNDSSTGYPRYTDTPSNAGETAWCAATVAWSGSAGDSGSPGEDNEDCP